MDFDDERPNFCRNAHATFAPPESYVIQTEGVDVPDPWEREDNNRALFESTVVSLPPLPDFSLPAWLGPTQSCKTGFGYFRDYTLVPYTCNPKIHYPIFGYHPPTGQVHTRTINTYYPFNQDCDPVHNLLSLWVASRQPKLRNKYLNDLECSAAPNPLFIRATGEFFSNELDTNHFLESFNIEKLSENVSSIDYVTSGRGTARITSLTISTDPIKDLRDLVADETLNFEQTYTHSPSSRPDIHRAKRLLHDFSRLPHTILTNPTARKNFIWACEILVAAEETHPLAQAQLRNFVPLVPTIVKWQESFILRKANFEERKNSYEDKRQKARLFLQDYDEFITSYMDRTYLRDEDDEDHPYMSEEQIQERHAQFLVEAKDQYSVL